MILFSCQGLLHGAADVVAQSKTGATLAERLEVNHFPFFVECRLSCAFVAHTVVSFSLSLSFFCATLLCIRSRPLEWAAFAPPQSLLTNLANLSSSFGESMGKIVQQEALEAEPLLKQDEMGEVVAMFESTLQHARELGAHFSTWGQAIATRAVAPLQKHNSTLGAVTCAVPCRAVPYLVALRSAGADPSLFGLLCRCVVIWGSFLCMSNL